MIWGERCARHCVQDILSYDGNAGIWQDLLAGFSRPPHFLKIHFSICWVPDFCDSTFRPHPFPSYSHQWWTLKLSRYWETGARKAFWRRQGTAEGVHEQGYKTPPSPAYPNWKFAAPVEWHWFDTRCDVLAG